MTKSKNTILIIGAGPAGLTCGYELLKNNIQANVMLLDKNETVGGLARSIKFKNFYFDIGPHRFYTKNNTIRKLWNEILGKNFVPVKRYTRILYKGIFFNYPIGAYDVIKKLGISTLFESFFSYVYASIIYFKKPTVTFEDWVVKHFGYKLYSIFFKTYTEKIWGVPCHEIDAKWAAQRIKNLSVTEIIFQILTKKKKTRSRSLVDAFYYPKKGSGMMYEELSNKLQKEGIEVKLQSKVVTIIHKDNKIKSVCFEHINDKQNQEVDYLFSSMPLTHFIFALYPQVPKTILHAAKKLYYRDHITVNLIVQNQKLFKDNWIYIHSPDVKMSRVTNYHNFIQNKKQFHLSPISVEYFTFKTDAFWKKTDSEIIEIAKQELEHINLIKREEIQDGFVVRETESYPAYYVGHQKYYQILKDYVRTFENLQLIGRGGMYKYNNMDHAMITGLLGAKNYVHGISSHDIWDINENEEYFEEAVN